MSWSKRFLQNFVWPPDLNSIRFRLTAGVVLASALGIGSVAGWMNWRMQEILLTGHKDAVYTLSHRFREDVALYSDMMPTQKAVQKVVELRESGDIAIWIQSPDGDLLVKSETLLMGSWQTAGLTRQLQSLPRQERLEIATTGSTGPRARMTSFAWE